MISLLVAALLAQQPEDRRHVEALGADSPAERDRASAALERLGAEALPALRAGASSPNPEIAGRCADLLRKFRALELSTLCLEKVESPFVPFGRADGLVVTPDGRHAVGRDLEDVKVWELPSGRCVAAWRPHGAAVRDFALSPDGARILTWGRHGAALWELPSGRLVRRYDSLHGIPRSVVASPDGRSVGWTSWEAVEWVDARSGRLLWSRTLDSGTPVALASSPDGRRVAVISANDVRGRVLDARSGAELHGFPERSGLYSRVAYTRDGMGIVVANPDRRKALVYSADSGEPLLEAPEAEWPLLLGSTARVRVTHPRDEEPAAGWTVVKHAGMSAFSGSWFLADEDRLVVIRTMNDRSAAVYDASSGARLRELGKDLSAIAPAPDGVLAGTRGGDLLWLGLDGAERARVAGGKGPVESVFSAGPGRALWRDAAGVLRCTELADGAELWRREYVPIGSFGHALAPDARHAVGHLEDPGRGRQHLVRWDLTTGREVGRYASHEGYLAGAAVSPDGALVAASTRDGPLAVWETESRKRLWERKPGKNARWLSFAPDSGSLFAGDDEGRILRLGARDGIDRTVYAASGPSVRQGALSPDGRILAALSASGELSLFDAVEGARRPGEDGFGMGGLGFAGADLYAGSPPRRVDLRGGAAPKPALGQVVDVALDGTRGRVGALYKDRRFVVVDLSSGKAVWETSAPDGCGQVVLGPKAEFAVFFGGGGSGFRVLLPGAAEPSPALEGPVHGGSDPGRSVLYTVENDRLQRRDLRTLAVRREFPRGEILFILPCGSAPWVLASTDRGWARLDAETLEPLPPALGIPDVGLHDSDATGDLLLADDGFRDSRTGRLRAYLPHGELRDVVARFLDADGRRLRLVTVDGKVLTFGPRP